MDFGATTPVGIALIVLAVIVAVKAAKTVVKLVMLALIAVGVYLVFMGGSFAELNPFG